MKSTRLPLIFKMILALCTVGMMNVHTSRAQVFVGGTLTQNTTFAKANNPYIVTQELIVPPGLTLTIEPGTEVKFSSDTRLVVKGELIARGEVTDSIHFTLNQHFPNQSLWNGVVLDGCITHFDAQLNYISGTIVSFVSFYNSNYSITLAGNSQVLIQNCLIRKSSFGIYMNDATSSIIRNCRITQTAFGFFIPSGYTARNNIFQNNSIVDNFNIGVLINNSEGSVQFNKFLSNKIVNSYIGLYIGNDGNMDIGMNEFRDNLITLNELEGVRIYQDSTFFIHNTIEANGTGLNIRHSNNSSILGNIIKGNITQGILVSDSSNENHIEQNTVYANQAGILIDPGDGGQCRNNTFYYNTIYQNQGPAFEINSAPQGPIQHNTICLNGDTNVFINNTSELIHAEYNWWGTEQENLINSMIHDINDDPAFGLVQYKVFSQSQDTLAPILAPRNVVKKQVAEDVLVTWDPVLADDLQGYHVFTGFSDGSAYDMRYSPGQVTSLLIPQHSVFDSIAVSAYDISADDLNDQVEGHESMYIMARLSPYAGPDTIICINSSILLDQATAFNYESILWSTSGDGSFSGSHILKPRYFPGPLDYSNGQVQLKITITGSSFSISDEVNISFSQPPFAFAGADTAIFNDMDYLTSTALVTEGNQLLWMTEGDGNFVDPNELVTTYTPGTNEVEQGYASLILRARTACGDMYDTVRVSLQQGYSLNGRIHAGTALAQGSQVSVFLRLPNGVVKQPRTSYLSADGTFSINHILPGEYYLYALPSKAEYPDYAPTYYHNKLHWKDAYPLQVDADTYDLDIDLVKFAKVLPQGEGSISGICTATGPGQNCGNIAVLLYDRTATYLLGWAWVQNDGIFTFPGLPFGEYLLVGERAGYERFFSQVVSLSPEHPEVTNAELKIESFKISIIIPEDPGNNDKILAYPNPAGDELFLLNLPADAPLKIWLLSPDGKKVEILPTIVDSTLCSLDLSNYSSGIYFLILFSNETFLKTVKFSRIR